MSETKRQHFVPKMLLRRFSAPGEHDRVWQIRIDDESAPTLVSVERFAFVTHFYTLFRDRPHKQDDWFWEDLFAEWEGRATTAIGRLAADPGHIAKPAQLLVVFQLLRTPLGQTLLAEQASAERRRIFAADDPRVWARWFTQRKGRPPELWEWDSLREVVGAARSGEPHRLLEADATTTLEEMMTVARHSGFGERLCDDGFWNVLEDEQGRFVLGDEPVTYAGQHNPGRPLWAQEELPERLTMPLSPNQCLEVRPQKRNALLTRKEIEAINLRGFEWANRFVYGPDPVGLAEARSLWQQRGSPTPPPRSRDRRRRR